MLIEGRANEIREMMVVLSCVKKQAASAFVQFNRIRKANGSIYNSTRESVNSRTKWRQRLHLSI